MQRTLWYTLFLLVLVPAFLLAQSGKIRGTVVDVKTKEPLVGANIVVQGTNMGASTDVDGGFLIINVPVGTYELKASYVGYRAMTIANIRISLNLTSEVNFELPSEDVQVQTVEIVAERPLIQKNATNAVRFTTSEDIQNLPVRDFGNLVSVSAGVVQQAGTIYVRGGRQDQVGYVVEGVQTRDPLFGGNTATVISNAIEEIQVQTGGYNAEFGGANAGMVVTSLRTGGEKFKVTGEVITDGWAESGKKSLGGYSYGYNEYIATISGPIPGLKAVKFFVAGDNLFNRTRVRFWEGMNLPGIYDPSLDEYDASGNLIRHKYDLIYPAGKWMNDASNRWTGNGNIMADFKPFQIRLSGTYSASTQHGGADPTVMFNQLRAALTETEDMTAGARITHVLSPSTFYEVSLNFSQNYQITEDPYLKDQWWLYGDSVANAKYGFTMKALGQNPDPFYLFGVAFDAPGTLETGFQKIKQTGYAAHGSIVHQAGKLHELKAGFEYQTYAIRAWSLTGGFAVSYALQKKNNPTATPFELLKSVRLSNYGYDFLGNESDNMPEGYKAHKPVFANAYVQDKIEYQDLVINAGLRFDYFDIDQMVPPDPMNVPYDANGVIDVAKLVKVPTRQYVTPRLGFAFPVTDRTVFHAQWGKFVQQSRLRDIYLGLIAASVNIKGGNAIQTNLGWGLRPERTTQYELGFNQMLTDNSSFDVTMYYRDITDQVQARLISRVEGAAHQAYFAFQNGDFATTKGLEFKFTLRRSARIAGQAYYSYSDARGTGSSPTTAFRTIWQSPTGTPFFPNYVTPLDFNQAHRGNINLDYRFGEKDGGPILSRLGLNLLFSFNSGHNYTRIGYQYGNTRIPTEELNASVTPWVYQLDLRLDKSFRVGPVDLNVYLWVINVLNTKNVQDVYLQTGTADDDGYLATPQGQLNTATYGKQYADFYRAFLANGFGWSNGDPVDMNLWGTPRQIRFGLRFEY